MAWLAVRLAIAAVALLVVLPAAGAAAREPSTPELIDRAAGAGRVDRDHATLLLAQSLGDPARLPAAYRSSAPWDGTPVVARLRHDVPGIRDAAVRRRARDTLAAAQADGRCLTSDATLAATTVTAHFHLSYAPGTIGGGLSLGHWTDALESAWNREVTAFGWAAPPAFHFDPAPGGRVPVRLDPGLAPGLYGFVSTNGDHAGPVFDNPSTPWTEQNAQAVCMVLRSDYS